jgi:diguanylate cyclase (GGDEF)-like protein
MLFIDLDGFKQVNDQLGHHEGDKCLVKVATMIREAAVGKGKLFRPGGDEFVVVLPNFTRHEAAATAERIRTAIETGNPGGTKKVTASIGVTDSELAKDAATLYKRADDAMYVAKHDRKKNCVVVDDGSEIRKRAEGQI